MTRVAASSIVGAVHVESSGIVVVPVIVIRCVLWLYVIWMMAWVPLMVFV